MTSPLTSLLGKDGSPPMCKEIGEVAMHWFATTAKAGDPCLCGKTMQSPVGGNLLKYGLIERPPRDVNALVQPSTENESRSA